jgi:hypothetical protein
MCPGSIGTDPLNAYVLPEPPFWLRNAMDRIFTLQDEWMCG